MALSLPQNDPNPQKRLEELQERREIFEISYDRFQGIAMLKDLPLSQRPHPKWVAIVGEKLMELLKNSSKVYEHFEDSDACRHLDDDQIQEHHRHDGELFFDSGGGIAAWLEEKVGGAIHELKHDIEDVEDALTQLKERGLSWALEQLVNRMLYSKIGGQAHGMDDFKALFQDIPMPMDQDLIYQDLHFGRMRLAGPNPLLIELAKPEHLPPKLSPAIIQEQLGESTDLPLLLQQQRLFVVNLQCLKGAVCSDFPNGQKYICAPLAIFALDGNKEQLLPLAIQLNPDDPSWYTPDMGLPWEAAKLFYTTADGGVHQARSHLGHTHLVQEAFGLITYRHLSDDHPIYALLHAHFEGTFNINKEADQTLCKPQGGVDAVLSTSLEVSRQLAASSVSDYDFNANILKTEIQSRGLLNSDVLPQYPYRDDALLIWDAIHQWVSSYVEIHYQNQDDILQDGELQAWAKAMVARDGGRIKGFGEDDQGLLSTASYLSTALTQIIFNGSAQHAAVNFTQWHDMAFAPNYPLSAYRDGPLPEESQDDLMQQLPPLDMALYQLEWGYLLGTSRYTQLGEYHQGLFHKDFKKPKILEALSRFQEQLKDIEKTIDARNEKRKPYTVLKPSLIPQSINI
jgi:arachidonate 15-lipoxygenase